MAEDNHNITGSGNQTGSIGDNVAMHSFQEQMWFRSRKTLTSCLTFLIHLW